METTPLWQADKAAEMAAELASAQNAEVKRQRDELLAIVERLLELRRQPPKERPEVLWKRAWRSANRLVRQVRRWIRQHEREEEGSGTEA